MSLWHWLGNLVGGGAMVVGVVGLVLHLESRFFHERTLESLVYTAPFAAPLAYTGIGLLLVMNRMVDGESPEWPLWVLLLALGGFVGNFIFSLADHAQNGFFHPTEWIAVVEQRLRGRFSACALPRPRQPLVRVSSRRGCYCVQAAVGLLGFYYHNAANSVGRPPQLVGQLHLRRPGPGSFAISEPVAAGVHRPVGLAAPPLRYRGRAPP